MKAKRKRIWLLMPVLAAVLIAAAAVWRYLSPYGAEESAVTAMQTGGGVTVESNANWISFEPATATGTGVILYPGGLVEPESYSALARRLAERGHPVYVAVMPLNLAVTKGDAAKEIIRTHPGLTFAIGGHSLGGVMASRYASEHAGELAGVFFLAAYPDEKGRLDHTKLPVLSITATEDKVLNWESYRSGRSFLPDSTVYYSVKGGNHAQFGSYGVQKGDGEAVIGEEEQQRLTAQAMLHWLANLR